MYFDALNLWVEDIVKIIFTCKYFRYIPEARHSGYTRTRNVYFGEKSRRCCYMVHVVNLISKLRRQTLERRASRAASRKLLPVLLPRDTHNPVGCLGLLRRCNIAFVIYSKKIIITLWEFKSLTLASTNKRV